MTPKTREALDQLSQMDGTMSFYTFAAHLKVSLNEFQRLDEERRNKDPEKAPRWRTADQWNEAFDEFLRGL